MCRLRQCRTALNDHWHVECKTVAAGQTQGCDSSRGGGQPESAEFIQLLTPEGERVDHPDYPLEISADEVRALYRDLVLVRRIDFEAILIRFPRARATVCRILDFSRSRSTNAKGIGMA